MKINLKNNLTALALAATMSIGMSICAAADNIPSSGKAVIDFGDSAFFTVNMTSDEKVYLDLDTTYQKDIADSTEIDFDCFYNFLGDADTFNHKGLLFLPAEEGQTVYEIAKDGEAVPLEAEFVRDYVTIKGGEKANGYLFYARSLGNYGIALS